MSAETGWVATWDSEPPIAWRKKVGTGFGAVSVAGGRVFVAGNANRPERGSYYDTLYCLNEETGETIWEQSYPCRLVNRLHEGGPSATPTVAGDRVYMVSKVGVVMCLEMSSGKPLWEVDLTKLLEMKVPEWGFTSSVLVQGDRVIVQAGATVALDCSTGQVVWKSKARKAAYSTPSPVVVGDRKMLAVLNSEGLSILDANDGGELGFTPWETDYDTSATTPIVRGDLVFLSTGYNEGCGLFKVDTGGRLTQVYRNAEQGRSMSNHMNNAVLVGDYLYGFDGNTHMGPTVELVCMEFATGKVRWRQKGLGCGSLIAAARPGSPQVEGRLIVLSEDGRLVIAAASPESYKAISTEGQVLGGKCWTSPVLANGRVYGRNAKGDVVCVDLRGGTK